MVVCAPVCFCLLSDLTGYHSYKATLDLITIHIAVCWFAAWHRRGMLAPADVKSLKDAEEGTKIMAGMDYEHHASAPKVLLVGAGRWGRF